MFDLERFVEAQDRGGTYERALAELRSGRKTTHWMWFVFPQIAGLGSSDMNRRYAISGLDEARAYLAHPVLGERLRDCTQVLLELGGSDPVAVVLHDAQKLHSSMTLFALASDEPVFQQVLDRYFGGVHDPGTQRELARFG